MGTIFTTSNSKAWLLVLCFFLTTEIILRLHHFGPVAIYNFWNYTDRDLTDTDFAIPHPNKKLAWTLRPGASGFIKGHHVKINEYGYRDSNFSLQEWRNSSQRIAILGMSKTFGLGVEEKDSWTEVFEKMIKFKNKASVLNFSAPGYNLVQIAELYREKVIPFKPHVVILPIHMVNFATKMKPEPKPLPDTWLGKHQTIYQCLSYFYFNSFFSMIIRNFYKVIGNEDWKFHSNQIAYKDIPSTTGIRVYKEMLKDMYAKGIKIVFLEMPLVLLDMYKHIEERERAKFLKLANDNANIHFISVRDTYEKFEESERYIYSGEIHPNEKVLAEIGRETFNQYIKLKNIKD